jgi:hypothetical protein
MKDLFEKVGEFNTWRKLILDHNKHHNNKKNAIIEATSGEQFAANISINGLDNFYLKQGPIKRKYIEERSKLLSHPVNIERISFLVDNEVIEFVRC